MDDLEEITKLEELEPGEEEEAEESEEQTDDYYSYSSTDSSIGLSEHENFLQEQSETCLRLTPSAKKIFESGEEEETPQSISGTVEILSEQTELSDESAWDKAVPERKQMEVKSVDEEMTEVSLEPIRDSKVELEEDALEQIFFETEEMEEEEEEEEELLEPEVADEWEKERRIAQFQKDLEEVLNYEFPEDPSQEEAMKLQMYESMLKELEKEDKEIDIMLKELEKNEKTIHVIERTLGPLITHYEKEVCAFRKVGDDGFTDLEEEEEEDVEDEYRSRAAEMAKEILEADDIESVGSLGKESSGDDLSNMLSQMAADLKESEPEPEKEEQSSARKTPARQKKKATQVRRTSKPKIELKKKKK